MIRADALELSLAVFMLPACLWIGPNEERPGQSPGDSGHDSGTTDGGTTDPMAGDFSGTTTVDCAYDVGLSDTCSGTADLTVSGDGSAFTGRLRCSFTGTADSSAETLSLSFSGVCTAGTIDGTHTGSASFTR